MTDYLTWRQGRAHYVRRVPAELKQYDPRVTVRVSLKTRDPAQARRKADEYNAIVEKYWRGLVQGGKVHGADEAWKDAVTRARAYGFAYRTMAEIAEGDLADMVERLRVVGKQAVEPRAAAALLGGVDRPVLRASAAIDVFYEHTADRLVGRSPNQVRKWKNPRRRAVENFIASQGDIPVAEVSRTHALSFRLWWMQKVTREDLDPATANKDFMHLKDVIGTAAMAREIPLDAAGIFADMPLEGLQRSRPPFEADFVRDTILAPGVLDGMNEEARWIVHIMVETGAAPYEVVGLDPAGGEVVTDGLIPYIDIRPNAKRQLKVKGPNSARARFIPLVGIALEAARQIPPQGFTRYANPDSASAAINAFMKENHLRPTNAHKLYSLRHTFKDRLRDAGTPEEIIDELMGHTNDRPKYGRGHLLKKKMRWLKKIAFGPEK